MKDTREIAEDYTDWHIKTGGYARDMTLRDYYAGLVMQSLVTLDLTPHNEVLLKEVYKLADAMLKERAK
jgi:hypothetical protein